MEDTNFYIDKVPKVFGEEDRVPKAMEGTWWKYGLAFATIQVVLWLMEGFRFNPEYTFSFAFRFGPFIYGAFIFFGFFPFFLARVGLTRMRWFTLIGVLLGVLAYHLLISFEPTRRINLLSFTAYLQFTTAGISLGFLWEFGRWVFKKLKT